MQWGSNINSSDIGGILKRKNVKPENTSNHKDLLMFGYAAKVFRDDTKALFIDQGKHLLEWNGEKIDRFDVRATLMDLSQFEPPPGGYGNRLDYLPPEELRAEQLAEEERYYALNHNEEEELMYQEEELKRLLHEKGATYGQVQFDYNAEDGSNTPQSIQNEEVSKTEEPEKPYVPPKNVTMPYSILLPETMNQHVIIEKTARFISGQGPQMEILIKAKQSNNPKFEFLNQNNRFNPYYKFLLNSIKNGTYPEKEFFEDEEDNDITSSHNPLDNVMDNKETLESLNEGIKHIVPYKPSPNCAYTQLISKIKGVPLPEVLSQINSNLSNTNDDKTIEKKSFNSENKNPISNNVEIKKISTGLMLAQAYSSDSEESDNCDMDVNISKKDSNVEILIPPDNIKIVIDKTATYVKKNVKQFEETLKMKGDERFSFLNEKHEYYPYYMSKLNELSPVSVLENKNKGITPVSFSIKPKEDTGVQIKPALPQEGSDEDILNQNNCKKIDQNVNMNNQCNQQSSHTTLPEHVKRAIQLVENQLVARTVKANNIQAMLSKGNITNVSGNNNKPMFDMPQNLPNKNTTSLTSITFNHALNQKNLIDRQKELKLAEEKVKDRLAQIAREKLGLISKERQLQLERKKKAIAFLNHIKDTGASSNIIKSKEQENNREKCDKESTTSKAVSSYEEIDKEMISERNRKSPSSQSISSVYKNKTYTNNNIDVVSSSSSDSENSRSRKNKYSKSPDYTKSKSHKKKKSKHYRHHSKKKSKRKEESPTRSRSRSRSLLNHHRKNHKPTVAKKSKKHKHEKRDH